MFPNLDAEQARSEETNEDVAKVLNLSRNTYLSKKKTGNFTVGQINVLCEHFGRDFSYLFSYVPIRDM